MSSEGKRNDFGIAIDTLGQFTSDVPNSRIVSSANSQSHTHARAADKL